MSRSTWCHCGQCLVTAIYGHSVSRIQHPPTPTKASVHLVTEEPTSTQRVHLTRTPAPTVGDWATLLAFSPGPRAVSDTQ